MPLDTCLSKSKDKPFRDTPILVELCKVALFPMEKLRLTSFPVAGMLS